jgi:DNA-binding NarL/FixJ family response regulator
VVVLSNYAEPAYAMALLESGSEGRAYLLKERVYDRAQLVAAIQSVAAGGSMLDAKLVEALVASKLGSERSPLTGLTAESARSSPRSPTARATPGSPTRSSSAGGRSRSTSTRSSSSSTCPTPRTSASA